MEETRSDTLYYEQKLTHPPVAPAIWVEHQNVRLAGALGAVCGTWLILNGSNDVANLLGTSLIGTGMVVLIWTLFA